MPWGVAAAAVGAAGTLYASSKQSSAVKGAQESANAQNQQALEQQAAAQQQMRADLQPYTAAGLQSLPAAQNLLGLNGPEYAAQAMGNFQSNPGYQYQLSEGLRAVDSGAAARGMLRSGATMKAEQTLGANLANQSFDTYYNRLMGLTQIGQNSAAGVGAAGIQTANSQANVLGNMAQTAASAGTAQASIYGNTASGLGSAVNQGIQNYQYGQRTNALMGQQQQPYNQNMGIY